MENVHPGSQVWSPIGLVLLSVRGFHSIDSDNVQCTKEENCYFSTVVTINYIMKTIHYCLQSNSQCHGLLPKYKRWSSHFHIMYRIKAELVSILCLDCRGVSQDNKHRMETYKAFIWLNMWPNYTVYMFLLWTYTELNEHAFMHVGHLFKNAEDCIVHLMESSLST